LKSILKFLQELMIPCNLENFPAHVVAALPRIVPSELVGWTPTNFSQGRLARTQASHNVEADLDSLCTEVGNQHFGEHPFAQHYLRTGDRTACILSDFVSENQLHRLEGLYQKFLRPMGIEDHMLVVLPSTEDCCSSQPKEDVVIAIHRSKRDFTERDRLVLNLIRSHLIQAYRNAQALTQTQQELAQLNRTLEQIGTIILTRDLKVQRMTRRAWELLLQYFQVTSGSATQLPENLLRWIKHQICQLTVTDKISSPCIPLQLEREGKRLVVRLIPDLPNEQYLLFLQEELPQSFSPELLVLLGLTKREAEVLFWVAKDKSNREIALILGCREKTVQKHLEHIYGKLGVQTRAAAIVCALEQLGILNR
jgi:DNA-binding CsgD family transcriptional regulator